VSLGYFYNPIEAALAYDDAARALRGDQAIVNFPNGPPGEQDGPPKGEEDLAGAGVDPHHQPVGAAEPPPSPVGTPVEALGEKGVGVETLMKLALGPNEECPADEDDKAREPPQQMSL
jgi:hypothetical protein